MYTNMLIKFMYTNMTIKIQCDSKNTDTNSKLVKLLLYHSKKYNIPVTKIEQ